MDLWTQIENVTSEVRALETETCQLRGLANREARQEARTKLDAKNAELRKLHETDRLSR